MIKGFVISILPNPSEAEDIVQEVFLVITAKANAYEQGTNFKAWALTIARFKVLEHLRRERRSQNRFSDVLIERLAEEVEDVDLDFEAARKKALKKCLRRLSPKARTMIELQYEERLKPGVIADKIGWRANAVYVALSRARSMLRKCVERQLRHANP